MNMHSLSRALSRQGRIQRNTSQDGDAKNVTPRLIEEVTDRSMAWKLTEIKKPAHCRSLRLHANEQTKEIARVVYADKYNCIWVLTSNGSHHNWSWNTSKKVTTDVRPQFWKPHPAIGLLNDVPATCSEQRIHSLALTDNDCYAVSSSGGKVCLYNLLVWKVLAEFLTPPPAATSLAFHPQDNNIIAIGMDDGSIIIYNVRHENNEPVLRKLTGHFEKVTCLAFSFLLDVLVSFGADGMIIVWNYDDWEVQNSKFLPLPWTRSTIPLESTLQFHRDAIQFLLSHSTQLCLYKATNLECTKQWFVGESFAPISCATFSGDGELVYSSFLDGIVGIFRASDLCLQCLVHPSTYLPTPYCNYIEAYVIAANPHEPNQFAIGLSNGEVILLEPLESEGKWGIAPPVETASSTSSTMPTASSSAASASGFCSCSCSGSGSGSGFGSGSSNF